MKAQTSLEYLLLLAVVAVVVIAGFGPGAMIDQVHDAAQGYYNTVGRVIMDSDGTTVVNGTAVEIDNPKPVDGGWCPLVCPTGAGPNVLFGTCECPAPAFGGAYCPGIGTTTTCSAGQTCSGYEVSCSGNGTPGSAVIPCGPCPEGQVCSATTGQCGCSNQLTCNGQGGSPLNSIPGPGCTTCECPQYSYLSGNQCIYCPAGQSYNGSSCVPVNVSCPTNEYYNTQTGSCACDQYSYWNGTGCVYCPSGKTYNGSSCVPANVQCPTNMYFDTTPGPGYNTCQCIAGTSWNGTGCS